MVLHVSLVLKAMGGYSLKASLQHKKGKNVTKGHGPDACLIDRKPRGGSRGLISSCRSVHVLTYV